MNEAETRAEHIDPQLAAAGWGVVEGSRILREYVITPGRIEGSGKRGKASIADYVLVYRNIKLAVDEAKAWAVALTEGVGQSKNYAGKLAVRFAFASNGQGIYETDMLTGVEREVACYPSPQELWDRTFGEQDAWRDRFADVAYEDKGGSHPGRYYQDIACERVMAAIAAGCSRILLTLATGTGKTFIAFQIAWKLFHSRWNSGRRADPPPAHPVPGGPQHPGRSGLQRLLRLPGGCSGAHRAGGHPQEGQGAEERECVFYDLSDVYEWGGGGADGSPPHPNPSPRGERGSACG